MTREVQDAFATLNPNNTDTMGSHPFATYLRFTDGTHSQPLEHRSLRDCMISGNSMIAALMAVGVKFETVNVVFDERFTR